jgi:hypothetical protein
MDQKSGKPSQKRRAILQGSLAAPLVLTVSSAGAQVALTSSERALANLKDMQPGESLYFKDSPDNWFRRPVKVEKMKYKGKESLLSKEEWFYLDPAKNQYFRLSTMDWMLASSMADWDATKETSVRYLLVWVDPKTGGEAIKMSAKPSSNLIAATCSAIRSVNPAADCPPPTGNRA